MLGFEVFTIHFSMTIVVYRLIKDVSSTPGKLFLIRLQTPLYFFHGHDSADVIAH